MSDPLLLMLSFWINQSTILFILGCHTLAARAIWGMIGGWGKALTISSACLWIASFMRLVDQLRIYRRPEVERLWIPHSLAASLFFWSAVGFLCALAVGYVLRQTMFALVSGTYESGTA